MTFRLFIYYCALGGGWAAFLAWGLVRMLPVEQISDPVGRAGLIGGILGLFVAAALGLVDALLNAVGVQQLKRTLLCAAVGFPGGLAGGMAGQGLNEAGFPLVIGWALAGVFIGAAIGAFDVLQAKLSGADLRAPLKKMRNGMFGGLLGGLVGGFPAGLFQNSETLPLSGLAIGLTVLGLCIGLMVALAQVFLKEAWVAVEAGRRAGRQMMLSKDETTIGRAEGCDIGLFGEQGIEKVHARILMKHNRYVLEDAHTPGGTFVNESRVERPTPLNNGDAIRVGTCLLRFGERQKQR
ncbi:MAG: FHA domain-containing protein [Planctomycetes bacterium]|nr:FHA domain-containing protein [Planctomycetota bacterium]